MLELLSLGGKLLDKLIPDTEARDKAKQQLAKMQVNGELKELETSASVVMSEIKGESWLQRNWRPILMLVFTALIVTKWLGLSSDNLSPEIEMTLFEIVKIGIAGYIASRGGEKMLKTWAGTKQ